MNKNLTYLVAIAALLILVLLIVVLAMMQDIKDKTVGDDGVIIDRIEVYEGSPVPTPGPTPQPGMGFKSIAAFTSVPDPLTASLFPNRVDSGDQTVIAPGCAGRAPETRLIYVYVYPATLGELTFFGEVFNDVSSLEAITGFTFEETDYLAYQTPLIICSEYAMQEITVYP